MTQKKNCGAESNVYNVENDLNILHTHKHVWNNDEYQHIIVTSK